MSDFYLVTSMLAQIFVVTAGFLAFMAGVWLVMREKD